MLKHYIRKHIQFLVDYITRMEAEQVHVIKQVETLKKELDELKETFNILKSSVSEHKKSKDVGLKQKWLNGYPDDSIIKGD